MSDAQTLFNEAVAFHKAGRAADAEAKCREVLRLEPENFNALHLAGLIAFQTADSARAVELIGAALRIYPEMPLAYNNLAAALLDLGQYDDALVQSERAIALRPEFPGAHITRGHALRGLKRSGEALASYERALALRPDAEADNSRGIALAGLGRHEEALNAFAQALALNPSHVGAHHNRGVALRDMHRHDEALTALANAVAVDPEHADSHWEASLTHLQMGNFDAGWKGYEWRWNTKSLSAAARAFPQPLWRGDEPIAGKTILIHAEQGLGDTIQFCRYAAVLTARGAKVVLEVQRPLAALMKSLEGTAQIVVQGETLPAFDVHCPLMSLPLACRTTLADIPASPRYLHAPGDKIAAWQVRLGAKTKPRVGLVWSGNPNHKLDHARSIALHDVAATLPDGCDYFSLQTETRAADAVVLRARRDIRDLGPDLKDFTDTAAVCELMDVVVTVDTSVAHLAGALGKPTWLLLAYTPDWRWLLARADSPWYPSLKLYRQEKRGDWSNVLARVNADLARL